MNRTILKTSSLSRKPPFIISSRPATAAALSNQRPRINHHHRNYCTIHTARTHTNIHMNIRKTKIHPSLLHSNHPISTVPSSSHSSSTTSSSSPTSSTTITKRTRPPRPPTHTTLPTLDVSPILDPTLYLKKYSKSIHKRCGSEASKRLFKAQSKIRNWIWDYNSYVDYDGSVPKRGDGMYENDGAGSGTGTNTSSGASDINSKLEEMRKSLIFGLVGHGVPYQLFQDHVDTAWRLLVDQQQKQQRQHDSDSSSPSSDNASGKYNEIGNEIVECSFQNNSGELKMNWINIRNREGHTYFISNPLKNNDSNITSASTANRMDDLCHSVDLYLIVMNRLSRTFGTMLQEPRNNNTNTNTTNDEQHNSKTYWKHDKSIPIQYWKATIKRGFEYPPSATMFSSDFLSFADDDYDVHSGSNSSNSSSSSTNSSSSSSNSSSSNVPTGSNKKSSKETQNSNTGDSAESNKISNTASNNTTKPNPRVRGARCGFGEWTNPPIVELIDSTNNKRTDRGPSFVRVTIQGIPSFFWNKSSGVKSESSSTSNTATKASSEKDVGTVISHKDDSSGGTGVNYKNGMEFDRDDMVPISLVFEACFDNRGK